MQAERTTATPRASDQAPTFAVGLGIYLHIPFCVSKCSYCAFSSMAGGGRTIEPYVESLHQEIDQRSMSVSGRTVQSIYFGGGTPSLLPPAALTGLLAHCRQAFAVASDAEITLEANPETVTAGRMEGYLRAGVNRVSMGVQSLDAHELATLGRPHTADRAMAAYAAIRRAGCGNVNLDLIYGVPGQTVEAWRATLTRTLDVGPDHLSAYALTPEPGTAIGVAVANGDVSLPSEDVIDRMEAVLWGAAEQFGLRRYEVSNYATPGAACRHNLLYWSCDDWLGFGASAHSHLAGHRSWNRFDPLDYMHGVGAHAGVEGTETLTAAQRINEAIAFGLRMVDGVPKARLSQRMGLDPWSLKAPRIAELVDHGLVEDDAHSLRLTPRGLAMADEIAVGLF